MEKFKPGDRVVRVLDTDEIAVPIGSAGTFLGYDNIWRLCGEYAALVRWDDRLKKVRGHTCNGLCEEGYGWAIPECDLEHCACKLVDESDYDTIDFSSMISTLFEGE